MIGHKLNEYQMEAAASLLKRLSEQYAVVLWGLNDSNDTGLE